MASRRSAKRTDESFIEEASTLLKRVRNKSLLTVEVSITPDGKAVVEKCPDFVTCNISEKPAEGSVPVNPPVRPVE